MPASRRRYGGRDATMRVAVGSAVLSCALRAIPAARANVERNLQGQRINIAASPQTYDINFEKRRAGINYDEIKDAEAASDAIELYVQGSSLKCVFSMGFGQLSGIVASFFRNFHAPGRSSS
jgi:hypothetical protein